MGEHAGKDRHGCPIVKCNAVSKCPPMMLGCDPHTIKAQVGKYKNGCPRYQCIRKPCPMIKCPPFAKMEPAGKDKNGCMHFMCTAVSKCPPFLMACPPHTEQTQVGQDKEGCPTYKCIPEPSVRLVARHDKVVERNGKKN